jgi:acetyl esterase/lipase
MLSRRWVGLALAAAGVCQATDDKPFDAAAAFGARENVSVMRLSPNGKSVAFIAPAAGQGATLITLDLAEGSTMKTALGASGKPERLGRCDWVSNERLVCVVYGVAGSGLGLLPFTREVAVDRSGANLKLLSTRNNEYTRGLQLGGGSIVDWLPDENGVVLMSRGYLPDEHLGSHLGSSKEGLGVDRIDTVTMKVVPVEQPLRNALEYLSDGDGTVRIMETWVRGATGLDNGVRNFLYRVKGEREWLKLSERQLNGAGFEPVAVDRDLNVAYGFDKLDGRQALYTMSLDAARTQKLVLARPDVDIDKVLRSLSKALPQQPRLQIVDSSMDEKTLLVFAGSDDDPGVYYVFNRDSKELHTFLVARNPLEGIALAKVKPVRYPAADGTMVPGYLTLPRGREDAKGLPAIVLPHGGPSARDEWGFDWLSQFFAARGYAVLQPNFRGSAGYGDAWLRDNGFKSWRIAIGDVVDAGHWLVAQGIADPSTLCIFGWSYGGYAALQSAVLEPGLFKAVVAMAPVTDLDALKEEHRDWSDFRLVSDEVGDGPQLREGSPARNADKIRVPVLLFHAEHDRNVAIAESRLMDAKLSAAGVKHELVTWPDLDHYLEDSAAREQLLRKSDAFLREATGAP